MDGSVLCGNTPDQTVGAYFDPGGNTASVVCTPCPDINQDGIVEGADLALLLGSWGTCPALPCPADVNQDGLVDGADLSHLLSYCGPCSECR